MQKKAITGILVICLFLSMNAFGWGNQPQIQVFLDDYQVALSQDAYLNESAQLMLPLRELVEKMDYQVEWQADDQRITLTKGGTTIELKIGEAQALINAEELELTAAPVIRESRTFIPLSLFSEGLDQIAGWDTQTQAVQIRQPKEATEAYFTPTEELTLQKKVADYLTALQQHENFHGSVLVAKGDKIILSEGYGYADFDQQTLNQPQTRFAIGSISKQFTSMAIMQLSEKGLLNVDDLVSVYLPDFPHADKITLHQLLTHTSGLVNYTDLPSLYTLPAEYQNAEGILALIKDLPLQSEPGAMYVYNNTGYFALTLIVEQVSGQTYEGFLQENIFDPLNMQDTGMLYGEENHIHDATAYMGYLEVMPVDDKPLLKVAFGAGSLYSTVEDLYRWERALNTDQLVNYETLDKIFTGYVQAPGLGEYAYGWVIREGDAGREIFHTGGTLGFSANLVRYADQDVTIITLVNNSGVDIIGLTDTLGDIVFEGEYDLPAPVQEITLDDYSIYDAYEGVYDMGSGMLLTVTREGDRLFAQVTGDGNYEIFPESEADFFYKIVDARITFVMNEDGQTQTAKFQQSGLVFEAPLVGEKEVRQVAEVDPDIYEAYKGEYELYPGVVMTITTENDQIFAAITGQQTFEIYPESEIKYFYLAVDAQITFVKDEAGNIVGLVLHQNGMDMPGEKIK